MRLMFVVTAMAALGAAAPAMAQSAESSSPGGIYGNLGWGETTVQGTDLGSITGRVGGRYGRYLGVEGELSYGLQGDSRTFAPGALNQTSVDMKRQLQGAVYGVGFLPLGSSFDLLARVGYGASRYRVAPAGLGSYDANEHGVRYGVGAQYFLTSNNGVRLDWTREHMDTLRDSGGFFSASRDATVWSATLAHKF